MCGGRQRRGPAPVKRQRLPARRPGRFARAADATRPGRARRGLHRAGGRDGLAGDAVAGDSQPAGCLSRSGAAPARGSVAAGPAAQVETLSASERDQVGRARWRARMGAVDPERLVGVDECGTHTSTTRRRARGARCRPTTINHEAAGQAQVPSITVRSRASGVSSGSTSRVGCSWRGGAAAS